MPTMRPSMASRRRSTETRRPSIPLGPALDAGEPFAVFTQNRAVLAQNQDNIRDRLGMLKQDDGVLLEFGLDQVLQDPAHRADAGGELVEAIFRGRDSPLC